MKEKQFSGASVINSVLSFGVTLGPFSFLLTDETEMFQCEVAAALQTFEDKPFSSRL